MLSKRFAFNQRVLGSAFFLTNRRSLSSQKIASSFRRNPNEITDSIRTLQHVHCNVASSKVSSLFFSTQADLDDEDEVDSDEKVTNIQVNEVSLFSVRGKRMNAKVP